MKRVLVVVAFALVLGACATDPFIPPPPFEEVNRWADAPPPHNANQPDFPCGPLMPICLDQRGNKVTNEDLIWVSKHIYCWPNNVKRPRQGCQLGGAL